MLIRLRQVLLFICALGLAWGALVLLTGGFTFRLGSLRLSSRTPLNPLLVSLVSAGAAFALSHAHVRATTLRAELARSLNPARLIAMTGVLLFVYQWAVGRPLWLDEEMIALNIRERSLSDLARGLWLGQSAPFGWLAAERAIVLTLGDGERAMRFVPLLFAISTVLAAWWIGRRWMGWAAATVLVLLCSLGQWLSFYSLELKHYSADVFWALLLPALGAWVLEATREREQSRAVDAHLVRASLAWWALAAIGQWLANGAMLVTPGVAAALVAWLAVRRGSRAAATFAASGLLWVAAFALHYFVAIRHAVSSAYLEEYWSFAFPRAGTGLTGVFPWLIAQARPLAIKPGGTGLWLLLWIAAGAGLALARTRYLGWLFATVPLSAGILAAGRLVPLYERLSLWIVPALYVGIALLLDGSVRALTQRSQQGLSPTGVRNAARETVAFATAVLGVTAVALLSGDLVWRGIDDLRRGRPAGANHRLDDRTAVRWLMGQQRPGDVLLTTRLALPALWWYGEMPISDTAGAGSVSPTGVPILELRYEPAGPRCHQDRLAAQLRGAQRALVFYGFRFDDVPMAFDGVLLQELSDIGVIARFESFTGASRAAIVDVPAGRRGDTAVTAPAAPGCILAVPAHRW